MADGRSVLRIGEVARRTGVAIPTLRAWERRYGLLDPARTDGGHRLYSEDDVAHVRDMQRLLDDGWSAAAAAREVLTEPAPVTQLRPVPTTGDATDDMVARLHASIRAFDSSASDLVMDDVFARLEVPRALDDVLLPVLRQLGEGWQTDPRVIAREHFATNALRPRLQRLLRGSVSAPGRVCVAAAPESEDHDLGLLAGAVVAAYAGWRVHYLGARTPSDALERSVDDLQPRAVLVGAAFREHAEEFLAHPPTLRDAALVLGGSGFLPEDAARLPRTLVHQGPISDLATTLELALDARGDVG